MMKYIKSFSQGQITIPKVFREELGLGKEFWLKLKLVDQVIIAEPMEKQSSKKNYAKDLLSVKGEWFDEKDYKKMRQDLRKRKYG